MNTYEYDKNALKESISDEQMFDFLSELGSEPVWQGANIINKTICHHSPDEPCSHKLYYYSNSKLFKCYTNCGGEAWDIFELVRKVKSRELNNDFQLPQAIEYVAKYFGFSKNEFSGDELGTSLREDWKILENYDRIDNINEEKQTVELKEYDGSFLKHLPHPIIEPWIKDGISQEVMNYYEICYDPKNCGIVIPHRDINGRLIGIRERTLIKENAEKYGKYMPMRCNGKMYNHPLSFALYGLYQNQDNIKALKKAFVFESEKSVMQYGTMFGQDNNIGVAICGSSFIQYQAWLLMNLGVEEIIVGLDKQYQRFGEDEHKKLVKNLKQIHKKYGHFVKIEYLFDKEDLLGYKDSPTDRGKEVFTELYRRRVNLY